MHDVLIAGGGPAGLAVAIGAARAGLDVVVVEKRVGTIDKACGEGLMPGALRALQALGVDPVGHSISGIIYRQGGAVARAPFKHGPGRGVRRTVLHDAMWSAASTAGVEIRRGTVDTVTQTAQYVEAYGERARYLVVADGLHSRLRSTRNLSKNEADIPRWGIRRHFALSPASDTVEVTWAARSEAYVTPVAADTVGVAILSSDKGSFDEHLSAFPSLAARVRNAEPVSTSRGAGPLRQRVRSRVHGRVLLVGDAAGYIDALTGEGLAVSLAAAAQLVDCVVRDRPGEYERAWKRVSRRSRWITESLLWSRNRPALAGRIVPLAARAPRVFGLAVGQLAQ